MPVDASAVPPLLLEKEARLVESLCGVGPLLVAFSGGVDSSYLAFAAHRALGSDALAVTALSASYPAHQRALAETFVARFGIRHRFVETGELADPAYRANGPDRCYHCKTELFRVMEGLCGELGVQSIAYGINADDTRDFRPGHRAAAERDVLSPLLAAGLSKQEIRQLSRRAGLPTAELPASPCLSSRLPYGTEVTPERLRQVEEGESILRGLGFRELRLRHLGERARLEFAPDELPRALEAPLHDRIRRKIQALGFRFVEIDPRGYRMGSLNEALGAAKRSP